VAVGAFLAIVRVTSSRAEDPDAEAERARTILFGSVEMGRSTHVGSGFKRPLGSGPDRNGFLLMGSAGTGILRDREMRRGNLARVNHVSNQASLAIGHQWAFGPGLWPGVWAVFLGVETDFRQPLVDAAALEPSRPLIGARLHGEVWLNPSDLTVASAVVIAGSARRHLWARAAWGYRIWNHLHLGPEAVVSLEPDDREVRLGLHAGGLRFGRFHFGVSGGLLLADRSDAGAYFALVTHFPM
jgi:hypothetical protein